MVSTQSVEQDDIEFRLKEYPLTTRRIAQHGFLELEDSWGDEATIINTARISTTDRRVYDPATFTAKDRALLKQLLKDKHGTPFETIYFRYRIVAPIFVMRQWVKHRISSWNEFSMRYRPPMDTFYTPDKNAVSVAGFELLNDADIQSYNDLMQTVLEWQKSHYEKVCNLIDVSREQGVIPPKESGRDPYRGRARELLRNVIPVSAYSDVYWTVNFRSLMNFFELRRKPNAQYEMREYAEAAFELFSLAYPLLSSIMEELDAERTA
jgi:thymidylate synthase (FAD)